ncbi:MAG: sulfatase-like hydrolase/transferase [Planctomycetota bacterium]
MHPFLPVAYRLVAFAAALLVTVTPAFAEDRPDIVVIMADDLGFADLGSYGGEIDTPNLDALADRGVRFSRFRVAPMCVVSRVAMIAGQPMAGGGDARYTRSVPLFTVLREAGYTTLFSGKWHAGQPDPRQPELFDEAFGFLGGMTDCYAGGPDWFDGDQPFTDFSDGTHATDRFTDKAIEFLRQHEGSPPDALFLSYNAPHGPLQAPRRFVEKYAARYADGFEVVRDWRFARQVDLGLFEPDFQMYQPAAEVRRWDELPRQRQNVEADRMAAYAGMVDHMDAGIGRLIAYLRESGRLNNTLIVFLSDNGGDYSNGNPRTDAKQIPWQPGSNANPSNGWAWVKNTPFRSFKHSSYEGALASPLIFHWPNGVSTNLAGQWIDAPAYVTDLYPTLIELAGAEYPAERIGKKLLPLAGSSLVPLLQGRSDGRDAKPAFAWYHESRAWIEDEWKATQLYGGPWQLFDLRTDRGEKTDLATEHPGRLDEYVAKWHAQADPGTPYSHPPRQDPQRGWGWHRINRITGNQLRSLWPANGANGVATKTPLALRFKAPLDFSGNTGQSLRLYADADESGPVYEATFDGSHPAQGKTDLVFLDLPELEPDAGYHVVWQSGLAKVGDHPLGPLNNGAYWWRFRTSSQ